MRKNLFKLFLVVTLLGVFGCASTIKHNDNEIEIPAWVKSRDVPRVVRELARLEEAKVKLELAKGDNLINAAKAKNTTVENAVEMTSTRYTRVRVNIWRRGQNQNKSSNSVHHAVVSKNKKPTKAERYENIFLKVGQKKKK